MNTSAKITLFSQPTKKGYPIKIRIIQNRKALTIGLKYFLTESQKVKYWNGKELRKSYPFYNEVNNELKKHLKNLGIKSKETTIKVVTNSQSFTQYFKAYIEDLKIKSQYGLLQKTNSVLYHLNLFCKENNRSENILFKELNIDYLKEFQIYMVKKNISPITQKGYFEVIRSVLNRAIREDKYNPSRHPFLGLEFIRIDVNPKCLNPEQFEIFKKSITSVKHHEAALKFMFQYYTYGMRVSDMLMMQWQDIQEYGRRIKYKMFKTKQIMDIALNNELVDILYYFLDPELQKEINIIGTLPKRTIKRNEVIKTFEVENKISFKHTEIFKELKTTNLDRFEIIRNYLHYCSTDKEIRNNKIFSDIPETDIKTTYQKIQSSTYAYNLQLKELSKELEASSEISFNISSHQARHTFAYISLLSGQSVYYISKALNHKSLKTTENYLRGFDNRQLDGKFYKVELSKSDKKSIDVKIKELLMNADYDKKKKFLEFFDI